MSEHPNTTKTLRKGLGWNPDEPDERDYDLAKVSKELGKSGLAINLNQIYEILKKLAKGANLENDLETLEEGLEKFQFIDVNCHKIIRLEDKGKQVRLLKYYLGLFYQVQVEIYNHYEDGYKKEAAERALMGVTRGVARQLVFGKELKESKKPPEKPSIGYFPSTYAASFPENARYERIKNLVIAYVENNYEGITEKEKERLYLGVIDELHKSLDWFESEKFDLSLSIWVRGFKSWKIYCKKNRCQKDKDSYSDPEYSYIDGTVIDFATYSSLEYVALNRDYLSEYDEGKVDKNKELKFLDIAPPIKIPFPSTIPPDTLKVLIEKLIEKSGITPFSIQTLNIETEAVEAVARQHFFSVEPIISVITQILGPFGTYPKTLETALEMAVVRFLMLLEGKDFEGAASLDELIKNFSDPAKAMGKLHKEVGRHKSHTITLGSALRLSDNRFIELKEEVENLKHLRSLAIDSIIESCKRVCSIKNSNLLSEKIKEEKKKIAEEKKKIARESKENEDLESCKKLRVEELRINIVEIVFKLYEMSKPHSQNTVGEFCCIDSEDSQFKELVILEIPEFNGRKPKTGKVENMRKVSDPIDGWEDNSFRWWTSRYVVPAGEDLLRNIREEEGKLEEKGLNGIRGFTLLPKAVDLTYWCSPIVDQGSLQSCSAQAGAALVEYFLHRYEDDDRPVARRFLYKLARNLANRTGDTGASLRETIRAMVLFGVPPEAQWRYDEDRFDDEPTPFCYAFAQNYQGLKYFKLDRQNVLGEDLLTQIKIVLAAGFPCMFGLTIHESAYDKFNIRRGYIPYPGKSDRSLARPDKAVGGHALVAVGYHDFKKIMHSNDPKEPSTGAVLVRNSWGTDWGLNGYGWLPYDYVLQGLTADWWSFMKPEWLESGKFGLGGSSNGGKDVGTMFDELPGQ